MTFGTTLVSHGSALLFGHKTVAASTLRTAVTLNRQLKCFLCDPRHSLLFPKMPLLSQLLHNL